MLEAFQAEHNLVAKKAFIAEKASQEALGRHEICQWQQIVISQHVQLMVQSKIPFPSFWPFPIAFSEHDVLDLLHIVTISNYLFCAQGFELVWDCIIFACQHVYHS